MCQNIRTEPTTCSVIIQKITHLSAILTCLHQDILNNYTEVSATNKKPPHYKVKDVNSLIHTVIHSNYPDLSETRPPLRRSSLRTPIVGIKNLQPSQFLNRPSSSLSTIFTRHSKKNKIDLNFKILMSLIMNIQNFAPFVSNINFSMQPTVVTIVK